MSEKNLGKINRLHLYAGVLFLGYAILIGIVEFNRSWRLVDDQVTVAAMVLKDIKPELFPNDPLLSNDFYKIYAPPVRGIIGAASILMGDIEMGHRLLVPILALIFQITFYALIFSFVKNVPVSALITVAAVATRRSIPHSFFGVLGMEAIYARTFFLAFAPLVILLFWHWRDSRKVVWAFLLLGIISNFHPTGGYTMTPMLAIALILYRGIRVQTLVDLGLGLVMALVGISPFLFDYFNYPQELLVDNGLLSAVSLYPVSPERFAGRGYVFPLPPSLVAKSFMIGLDVLLFSLIALVIRWKSKSDHNRFIISLAIGALGASLGGTAFLQFVSWLQGETLWYSELIRGTKWIYFALFLGTALFFNEIRLLIPKSGKRRFYMAVFGCFLLFYPLFPAAQLIRGYWIERSIAAEEDIPEMEAGMGEWLYRVLLDPFPESIAAPIAAPIIGVSTQEADNLLQLAALMDEDYQSLGDWFVDNSAVEDRILVQNPHFKLISERELGEQIIPDAIPVDVRACYEEQDSACLIEAAENHQAAYIVTSNSFPDLDMPVVFENLTYRIYKVDP